MIYILVLFRSEIHEKMNCSRCEMYEVMVDHQTETNCSHSDHEDIGGFARIAGCLDKLKSSEKQVSICFYSFLNWK